MERREVLTLIGGALGLAASGSAFAAPVTGLEVVSEEDVPGRMARTRGRLAAIRARPVPDGMQAYLATHGLPADTLKELMASLAATAAFRELDHEGQAHPAAQAFLDEEAPRAGLVGAHLSRFLKHGSHAGIGAALRERPELDADIREKIGEAAAALGISGRWVEVLDHHVESAHWRMRHQSAEVEASSAVATVDERWRAAGLDPDELRGDMTLAADAGGSDDAGTAAQASRRGRRLKKVGGIMMGVGGSVALVAIVIAVAAGGEAIGTTALVVLGVPALIVLLVGVMLFTVGAAQQAGEMATLEGTSPALVAG